MSDVINLGTRMQNLDVSPQFDTYSRVVIHIDDDTQVSAGNNSGRTFEVDNPLGTQALANEMLARLKGFRYQPYQADGALLDPAAEIGDAVDTPSAYGGIYTRNRTFGRLMKANISAPYEEEINHEYQFESPTERKFKREMGDVRASLIIQSNMIQAEVTERKAADGAINGEVATLSSRLTQTSDAITAEVTRATQAEGELSASFSIQATQIAAKVNSSGGGGSFSWVLDSSSHTWKSNNTAVMRISASGLWLKGQIEASSGKIGGFDIGANALTYNGLNWGDTSKNKGVYIGQSGIQLGKNFKVDNAGNVTANNVNASNMKLTGTLTIGDSTISANDLRLGAQRANSGYSSWDSAYGWTSSNGSYATGGAYWGYQFDKATDASPSYVPSYFTAGVVTAKSGMIVGPNAGFTYHSTTLGLYAVTIGGQGYWLFGALRGGGQ